MLRILRAFAWMRWRVLVNAFERTGARDTLERFSLATEQLGPIIAAVLMIPSMLGLSALSGYAGYSLATSTAPSVTFTVLRLVVLAASVLCVIGPLLLPVMEKTNAVRLLLLPIPRSVLYFAQSAGALADPWVAFVLPIIVFLPLGMAIGGAFGSAAAGLGAGLAFGLVMIGLSMMTSSVTQLVVRDRRRGELIALLFILVIPVASMLPGILETDAHRRSRARHAELRVEQPEPPSAMARFGRRALASAPSELYVDAVRSGVTQPAAALSPVVGLGITALLIHSLGLAVFTRLLDAPDASSSRRRTRGDARWGFLVPGLSSAASAVALAHMRLAVRTPRGQSILLSPLVVFLTLSVMLMRRGDTLELGALTINGGAGLATFGMFVSLMSVLPFALNQFAVDGPGLTMEFLSPISDADLLAGKAVANGAIASVPAAFCFVTSYVMFPGGSPATWLCIPPGIVSTYLLSAPVAGAVSALLPRTVNLNSIGRGSNAHGAAGLVGLLTFVVSGLPALAFATLPGAFFRQPWLGPALLLVWCALTYVACRLLFVPVRSLLARRRENLTLVV